MEHQIILGWSHLATAIGALVIGGAILLNAKGTKLHRLLGQSYIAMMTPMLISAFFLFRLTGSFNIFHYAAVAATLTLAAGLAPLYFMSGQGRIELHKRFMYWSVVGLYMALVAETLTRIPGTPFMPMVYLASGSVMVVGLVFYRRGIALR